MVGPSLKAIKMIEADLWGRWLARTRLDPVGVALFRYL